MKWEIAHLDAQNLKHLWHKFTELFGGEQYQQHRRHWCEIIITRFLAQGMNLEIMRVCRFREVSGVTESVKE